MDYEGLIEKAIEKYRKYSEENGYGFMAPSLGNCGIEDYEEKEYVVIRNNSELLSVWLIEDGELSLIEDEEDMPSELLQEKRGI